MNRSITVIILVVVLAAMSLVMYFHTSSGKRDPALQADAGTRSGAEVSGTVSGLQGPASPMQSQQGAGGGLDPIAPPIASGQPAPGRDGVPRPVTLTTGTDGRPARVPEQAAPSRPAQPATPPAQPATPPARPATPPARPATPPAQPATSPAQPATPPAQPSTLPPLPTASAAPTHAAQPRQPAETPPAQPSPSAVKEKPSSGSPGLMPWTTPPRTEKPAASPAQSANAQSKPKEPEKSVAISDKDAHSLNSIAFSFAGQSLQLNIKADTPFPCKTFILTGPDRLVVDLPGVWKGMRAPATPQNRLVKAVRLGQQKAGPRLVLDLTGPLKRHTVERSGNTVTILLQ